MKPQGIENKWVAPDGTPPWQWKRKQLGRSVWLLLLLQSWRSPSDIFVRSGSSIRAQELAEALGIGERQARRDLQRLRKAGCVELQNTGRGFKIRIPVRSLVNDHRPGPEEPGRCEGWVT